MDGLMQRALALQTTATTNRLQGIWHSRTTTDVSDGRCGYDYVYRNAPGIPLATISCSGP